MIRLLLAFFISWCSLMQTALAAETPAQYPVSGLTVDISNANGWTRPQNAFSAQSSVMFHMDGATANTYVKATVDSDVFVLTSITWTLVSHSQSGHAKYDFHGCTAQDVCTVLMDGSVTDQYSNSAASISVNANGIIFKYFKIVKDSTGSGPWMGGLLLRGTGLVNPPPTFMPTLAIQAGGTPYPVSSLTIDTSNAAGWTNPGNAFSADKAIQWHMDGAGAFTFVKATVASDVFVITAIVWTFVSHSQANYARYDVVGCDYLNVCTVLMDGSETDQYSNREISIPVNPTALTFKYFKIVKDSTGSGPWMGGLQLIGKLTGTGPPPPPTFMPTLAIQAGGTPYPVSSLTIDTSNAAGWTNPGNAFSADKAIQWHMDGAGAFTFVKATVASDVFVITAIVWTFVSHSQANYARYDLLGCDYRGMCSVLMDGSEMDQYSNQAQTIYINPTGRTFKSFRVLKDGSGSGPWMGGVQLIGKLTGIAPPSAAPTFAPTVSPTTNVPTSMPTRALCPAGSYFDAGRGSQCVLCAQGSYSPYSDATSCLLCDAGTASNNIGSSSNTCTYCPAGMFSSQGATKCTPCSNGTYSWAGSSMCEPCPGGFYSFYGQQCEPCGAGTYSLSGASSCSQCASGQFSTAGASICLLCSPA